MKWLKPKLVFHRRQLSIDICLVYKTSDKKGERELIQVTWDMSDPKTAEREMRALVRAEEELGIKRRIMTSRDYAVEQLGLE